MFWGGGCDTQTILPQRAQEAFVDDHRYSAVLHQLTYITRQRCQAFQPAAAYIATEVMLLDTRLRCGI